LLTIFLSRSLGNSTVAGFVVQNVSYLLLVGILKSDCVDVSEISICDCTVMEEQEDIIERSGCCNSVGSSHIEGVEYGTCFASSVKNENLNLSTSVTHTKKVLLYY
jgi:hypothetical protein